MKRSYEFRVMSYEGKGGAPSFTHNSLLVTRYSLLRPGYTMLEVVAAFGVLTVAMVIVAQLGTRALTERVRADEQMLATESAANVLEAARARPWADLTPDWAAGQRLPEDVTDRLPDARLAVRVEPEPERPRVKRVTVELRWQERGGPIARAVTTVALFADRAAGGAP